MGCILLYNLYREVDNIRFGVRFLKKSHRLKPLLCSVFFSKQNTWIRNYYQLYYNLVSLDILDFGVVGGLPSLNAPLIVNDAPGCKFRVILDDGECESLLLSLFIGVLLVLCPLLWTVPLTLLASQY